MSVSPSILNDTDFQSTVEYEDAVKNKIQKCNPVLSSWFLIWDPLNSNSILNCYHYTATIGHFYSSGSRL